MNKMNTILILILAIAVTVAVVLNINQAKKIERLEKSIERLEAYVALNWLKGGK